MQEAILDYFELLRLPYLIAHKVLNIIQFLFALLFALLLRLVIKLLKLRDKVIQF